MNPDSIALIVVHGVADQKPGDTARAVVDLMVAATPPRFPLESSAQVSYTALGSEDIVLEVEPLPPDEATPPRDDATPHGDDRSVVKAGLQSFRSDFQRPEWKAAATVKDLRRQLSEPQPAGDADRGIRATNYLLAKHRDNGAGREAYDTSRIHVARTEAGETTPIAVYEMYWADLSRLSGALPRIVTELFTMVFRLSKLGRDTVDEACRWRGPDPRRGRLSEAAWRVTNTLQIAFDWLFANGLAILFAQLFLLAMLFVALGLATLVDGRTFLHQAIAVAAALLSVLLLIYHRRDTKRRLGAWLPPLLVAAAAVIAFFWPPLRPWLAAAVLVGAVSFVYDIGLRIADDRFPLVRAVGRLVWAALVLAMLASAIHEIWGIGDSLDPHRFDVGWHAAIFGVELTLAAIKLWWMGVGLLLFVWFVAGLVAAIEKNYEARASLATGRLGLVLSLAGFLTVTMAVWALLTTAIDWSSRNVAYSSCIFPFDERLPLQSEKLRMKKELDRAGAPYCTASPPAAGGACSAAAFVPTANSCLWRRADAAAAAAPPPAPSASSGGRFLADRYENSTTGFALLAAILILLIAFLGATFTPSVLAELKLLASRRRNAARKGAKPEPERADAKQEKEAAEEQALERARTHRLGRWLTGGFRCTDGAVLLVTGIGILFGVVVAVLFIDPGVLGDRGVQAADRAFVVSQSLLKPVVLTAAGIVAALTVLGGLLSRFLPALRAPLDIALDVDNHFREFPRDAIPRARIFSRYAALLRHVAAQNPARIVIVAHSQGTVISAELLRFLSSSRGQAPVEAGRPRLDGVVMPPIQLLTLGCPLRQLYAARFPTLYRWVLARQGAVTGPRAHDIGVSRWINAFCSGDYVGRWLWSDSPDSSDPVGHPMVDTVDPARFGRSAAYDDFDPMPPLAAPFASAEELEVCLGLGAHTHYFEIDQTKVAWLIDSLLSPAGADGDIRARNIETP